MVLAGLFAMAEAALGRGLAGPGRPSWPGTGVRGARTLQAVAADAARHINLLLLLRLVCELTATVLVALVAVDSFGAGWRAALVTAGAMMVVSLRGGRRRRRAPSAGSTPYRSALARPRRWCAGWAGCSARWRRC